MSDIRQTPEYAKYLSKIGWKIERIAGINYFIRTLPVIGSIIKIQRPEKIDNRVIKRLAKKHRAFQIIIEPKKEIEGFKKTSPFLPSKTLCLDLTKSKEKLAADLKKDTRAALRKTVKWEELSR